MLIRAAITSDVEAIAAVRASAIRDVCGPSYDPSQIQAWISSKTPQDYVRALLHRPVFVAVRDGGVVGFSELDSSTGEVCAVYVHPDALREGVGRELLQAVETCATELALVQLNLHATLNAIPFYQAHGFVLEAMTSFPIGPDASLACARMHKRLPELRSTRPGPL